MKQFKSIKLLALLAVMSLFIACSKDKDDDKPTPEFKSVQSISEEVISIVPEGLKNSENEYAQNAISWIETATDWSAFSSQLTPPENAQLASLKSTNADTYKWTWNYGNQYSITQYWTYSEDASKEYWNLNIQYGEGTKYNYIDAWQSKSGVQGEIKYNFQWACAFEETEEECEDVFWTYTWNKDASDNYHFSYIWEANDLENSEYIKYETLVNADGSGTVEYYLSGNLFYQIEWDELGNGSWIYYLGETTQEGSWTVN